MYLRKEIVNLVLFHVYVILYLSRDGRNKERLKIYYNSHDERSETKRRHPVGSPWSRDYHHASHS